MADSPVHVSEGFVDRLGHLLLVVFAAGDPIEGEYDLATEAELIPAIRVSILREEPGEEHASEPPTVELGVDGFETALETFLLAEYARGIEIDGVWTVRYARSSLPEWSVDVEVSEPPTEGGDDSESPEQPNSGGME